MDIQTLFNMEYLINKGLTIKLKAKLKDLTTTEQIYLAATCKNIAIYLENLPEQINIRDYKGFNLDIFPQLITNYEIDALYAIHPHLRVLNINLGFARNHLLDSLHKYKHLRKLYIYLNEDDYNYNKKRLNIKSLTIKHTYEKSQFYSLYSLLEQFSRFETISIYKGFISAPTLQIFETQKLTELKLQDVDIENNKCWLIVRQILANTNLKKLKLTSCDYVKYPHPIIIMGDIIGYLSTNSLNIENLKFTLDQNTKILYKNLKHLKELKSITIYYNVQENNHNLEKVIRIVQNLTTVEVTFIEYVCNFYTNNCTSKMIKKFQEASAYYVDAIESSDKYMSVFPVTYNECLDSKSE